MLYARLSSAYDQERAESTNWVKTAIGSEAGRSFLTLIQQMIDKVRDAESDGSVESEAMRFIGNFARIGYLATMDSLATYFTEMADDIKAAKDLPDEAEGEGGCDCEECKCDRDTPRPFLYDELPYEGDWEDMDDDGVQNG